MQDGTKILKVFCKPTVKFPEGGYFYAPAEAESLVNSYGWYLYKDGNRVVIRAFSGDRSKRQTVYFHKELYKFYQGCNWNEDIDHISLISFDNTNNNLNAVTRSQNLLNTYIRGYIYNKVGHSFKPIRRVEGKNYSPFSVTYKEDEACVLQNYIEQVTLREKLGSNYYMFDFLKYRRGRPIC